MVSKEDADLIIPIICNDSEQLSKLYEKFDSTFNSEKYLSILSAISILLMDGILEYSQQIVVVWLIYKAFGSGASLDNPFTDVLSSVFQKITANSPLFPQKLGDIIGSILSSNEIDELGDHSASEILEQTFTIGSSTPASDEMPPEGASRLSPIIITKVDPKATQITQPHQLLKELLVEPLNLTNFETPFMRTIPELLPPSKEELRFSTIMNVNSLPFLLDEGESINMKNAAKSLIKTAKDNTLNSWQEECIIEQTEEDHSILSDIKISMDDINSMVKTNPKVAGIMMAELARKDHSLYKQFAEQDINEASCTMIAHTMICSNPPKSFFDKFVIHTVKILTSTKDMNVLKKKTKMLCDLITKLHKKNVEISSQSLIELQSLQVELSGKGVSEAEALSILFE